MTLRPVRSEEEKGFDEVEHNVRRQRSQVPGCESRQPLTRNPEPETLNPKPKTSVEYKYPPRTGTGTQ